MEKQDNIFKRVVISFVVGLFKNAGIKALADPKSGSGSWGHKHEDDKITFYYQSDQIPWLLKVLGLKKTWLERYAFSLIKYGVKIDLIPKYAGNDLIYIVNTSYDEDTSKVDSFFIAQSIYKF